jgi:HEAT repeat protein
VPTPAERAREDALFRDASLEATEAQASGKDPEAAASIIARKHGHAVVRLMAGAFARGTDADLLAARRIAGYLPDKGARLIEIYARAPSRSDKLLERCARLVGELAGPAALEKLKTLARDTTAAIRAAAFEGLARGLEPDALGKLARETLAGEGDESAPTEVKIAAIEALGVARAIGASAVCAKAVHDGDADVRKAVGRALARMGPGALPGILEDVRARGQPAIGLIADSVRAIAGGGDIANTPPEVLADMRKLLTSALRDKDTPVRWAAAVAVAIIGGKDEVPALDDAVTFEKDEMARANMECARADLKKRLGG